VVILMVGVGLKLNVESEPGLKIDNLTLRLKY